VPSHWQTKISTIDPAQVKPDARLGRVVERKKKEKETPAQRNTRLELAKLAQRERTKWKSKRSKKAEFANRPYKLIPDTGADLSPDRPPPPQEFAPPNGKKW
jgi:hypothetical protein